EIGHAGSPSATIGEGSATDSAGSSRGSTGPRGRGPPGMRRRMDKHVIFNADDFGASAGINRGVLECHTRGVLTSASLMVTGRATREAAAMSRDHPALAVGLH